MRAEVDVVVVGGGIAGVATLGSLARGGLDAVLLEQFRLGHDRGSSHGTSRIFRLSYPDPAYTRLAQEALAGWRELEAGCGETLVVQSGTLDLGDAARDVGVALAACEVPFEQLDAEAVSTRWPIAADRAGDAVHHAVHQRDGGFIRADRAHAAITAAARRDGAEVVEETAALAIELLERNLRVVTAGGAVSARAVVVAAGPWARDLLAPLAIDLPVVATRETVAHFAAEGTESWPSVIDYGSATAPLAPGQAYYALPSPGRGLKAGVHHAGAPTDPDADTGPDPELIARTAAWVRRRFPTVSVASPVAETCMYTNTVDERFVLERHGRVVVASPCSGHGFKFAPVVGPIVARLAREACTMST